VSSSTAVGGSADSSGSSGLDLPSVPGGRSGSSGGGAAPASGTSDFDELQRR
jgi:hypothetical protein